MCWFLYLIRTADNRLYTGITTDVPRRFLQHQEGKGAKALRGKGELALAFSQKVGVSYQAANEAPERAPRCRGWFV